MSGRLDQDKWPDKLGHGHPSQYKLGSGQEYWQGRVESPVKDIRFWSNPELIFEPVTSFSIVACTTNNSSYIYHITWVLPWQYCFYYVQYYLILFTFALHFIRNLGARKFDFVKERCNGTYSCIIKHRKWNDLVLGVGSGERFVWLEARSRRTETIKDVQIRSGNVIVHWKLSQQPAGEFAHILRCLLLQHRSGRTRRDPIRHKPNVATATLGWKSELWI